MAVDPTQINSNLSAQLPDNNQGKITAAVLRTALTVGGSGLLGLTAWIAANFAGVSVNNVFTGNNTHSGTETFTGSVVLPAGIGGNHVANNAALQAIIPTAGQVEIRDGFAAAGDGGNASYTGSTTNCAHADNGAQVQPSGTGCWILDPSIPLNPRLYGADPTGATDSTAAFTAALQASLYQINGAGNFYGPTYPPVQVPKGQYQVCGVTLQSRQRLAGGGQTQTYLIGTGGSCPAVVVFAQNPQSEPNVQINYDHAFLTDITVLAQGATNGINFADTTYTQTTHYGIAGQLLNVTVLGASQDNIRGGTNRNFAYFYNIQSQIATGAGISIRGYDWRMIVGDVGQNSSAGIDFQAGGAADIVGYNIYSNSNGLNKTAFANSYIHFIGGSLDDNVGSAANLAQASSGSADAVSFDSTTISNNGIGSANTFSQITSNLTRLELNGVNFSQAVGGAIAKYIINNTGGWVYWNGSTVNSVDGTMFGTAAFLDATHVVGAYSLSTTAPNVGVVCAAGSPTSSFATGPGGVVLHC